MYRFDTDVVTDIPIYFQRYLEKLGGKKKKKVYLVLNQMIQSQIITQTDIRVKNDAPEQHCIQHSFTNAQ